MPVDGLPAEELASHSKQTVSPENANVGFKIFHYNMKYKLNDDIDESSLKTIELI